MAQPVVGERSRAGWSGRNSLLLQLCISWSNGANGTPCSPAGGTGTLHTAAALQLVRHRLHLSPAPGRELSFLDLFPFPAEVSSGSASPCEGGSQAIAEVGSGPVYPSRKMDADPRQPQLPTLIAFIGSTERPRDVSEVLELYRNLFTWSSTLPVLL